MNKNILTKTPAGHGPHLIFFDVDGTLLNEQGEVSAAAVAAITELKQNGHLLFLATGRSRADLPGNLLDIGFHGYVLGDGSCVEYQGEAIYRTSLAPEQMLAISGYLEQNQAHVIYSTIDGSYLKQEAREFITAYLGNRYPDTRIAREMEAIMVPFQELRELNRVEKLVYFNYRGSMAELKDRFSSYFTILPNSMLNHNDEQGGEVSKKGITKTTGIRHLLEYLGKTREAVIAFGDGYNDVEMLQFAGLGIAMGNAVPLLKQYADVITETVEEDGVYHELKRLKLIS